MPDTSNSVPPSPDSSSVPGSEKSGVPAVYSIPKIDPKLTPQDLLIDTIAAELNDLEELTPLTPKQRLFVLTLPTVQWNASEAMRRSYSGRHAATMSTSVRKNPNVARAIEAVRLYLEKKQVERATWSFQDGLATAKRMLAVCLEAVESYRRKKDSKEAHRWADQAHKWVEILSRMHGFLTDTTHLKAQVVVRELDDLDTRELEELIEAARN